MEWFVTVSADRLTQFLSTWECGERFSDFIQLFGIGSLLN